MNKSNNYYQTSDFLTCNILLYFDHFLEKVNKSDSSRCIFMIRKEKSTDTVLEKFYEGNLLVEPKRFQAISKEIKSRIYN